MNERKANELSIFEKAKRFDEAIEKFDVILNLNTVKESGTIFAEDVRKILPELAESENELTWLTKYIEEEVYSLSMDIRDNEDRIKLKKLRRSLAWLEKQGKQILANSTKNCKDEQKPVDKVEPKFKVGKWIVNNISKEVFLIKSINNGYCILEDIKGNIISSCLTPCESESHLWTIQDAKDGDVLYSPCLSLLWIFKSRDTVYSGCNLNYNDGAYCGEGYFERPTDAIPATKIQRDILMKAMADAGYTFDFEKKELKKIEQKPTDEEVKETLRTEYEKGRTDAIAEMQNPVWSKKDEQHIDSLLKRLYGLRRNEFERTRFAISFLKSLKNRVGCEVNCTTMWKPSEEQMNMLAKVCSTLHLTSGENKIMESIYDALKKLRKE